MSRKASSYHPYSKDGGKSRDRDHRSHGHGPMRDHGKHDDSSDPRSVNERPTRTLFVRNINYTVNEKQLRETFEKYGEIKRIFNLIDKRGMAFVTYYDSRDSEKGKNDLQHKEMNGRAIDVHYALPKEDGSDVFPEDKNTGTLFVTFRSVGKLPVNSEVRVFFEKWGEIREVRDCKNSPNQKFIEYYDLRDCEKAFEEALNAKYGEGTLDVKYAFLQKKSKDDKSDSHSSSSRRDRDRDSRSSNVSGSDSNPPTNIPLPSLPAFNPVPGNYPNYLPYLQYSGMAQPQPTSMPSGYPSGVPDLSSIQNLIQDPSQLASLFPGILQTQPSVPNTYNPYVNPMMPISSQPPQSQTQQSTQQSQQDNLHSFVQTQTPSQLQNLQDILSMLINQKNVPSTQQQQQ